MHVLEQERLSKAQLMSIKIRESRAKKIIEELAELTCKHKSLLGERDMLKAALKGNETDLLGYK